MKKIKCGPHFTAIFLAACDLNELIDKFVEIPAVVWECSPSR